jgi:hydroxymethylbilane synthase
VRKKEIIIGARGSLLSICQTENVIRFFKKKFPQYSFSLKKITTLGDKAKVWHRTDKGIFVKEIEDELMKGEIDMAVHSMKDLPTKIPSRLKLIAVTKRENPRDVLITKDNHDLFSLKPSSVVGTSSLRRQAQILHHRPDLRIENLRGNLDTRIRKLKEGLYDAIVVAAAGLKRLGFKNIDAKFIPAKIMLPSCGQGALGIEVRNNDRFMQRLAKKINDRNSFICVSCERTFLRGTQAGCRMPVAAFARIKGRRINLSALIISLDGKKAVRLSKSTPITEALVLGKNLAAEALKKGGREILAEIENGQN